MPRPKVLPSQRKRAAEACNFCRTSKKKCSATVPCTACQRRGIGPTCQLTSGSRNARSEARRSISALPAINSPVNEASSGTIDARRGSGEADWALSSPQSTWMPPQPVHPPYQPISPSESRTAATDANQGDAARSSPVPGASQEQPRALGHESHARMLLNLRGERVYIGEAASISFLQFVRDTVAAQIGPSQFSHNDQSEKMLENEPGINVSSAPTPGLVELDQERRTLFIQAFHAATGGFLDLFSPEELQQMSLPPPNNGLGYAARHTEAVTCAVIAIGAQCKSATDSQQVGQVYFRHAQRQAFLGMLEDPDTNIVRVFLLMAYYMLGACRRNSAFMYLGIASRAAVSLGLHSKDSYEDYGPQNRSRLKIWMSLCVLDMTVSSLLGRPAATSGLRAELEEACIASAAQGPEYDSAVLTASYGILSITTDIVQHLYTKKVPSITLIERSFARIEEWSRATPKILCIKPSLRFSETPNRHDISRLHISCLYYFAVTLVSRPMLISQLTCQPSPSPPALSSLASACLDAAVYLVQTSLDAKKSGGLFGSMCIMKALVFAAGLILGFNMFAKRELDFEIETAFAGAREVLDHFSEQSAQAIHYAEILSLLSSAICKQRRKTASRGRSRLVNRLFHSDEAQELGLDDDSTQPASDSGPFEVVSSHTMSVGTGHWLLSQPLTLPSEMESELIGWDALDLSQWDNFPFNSPRTFMSDV